MNYKLTSTSWDEEEINAINAVVKSRQYSMSKNVFEFEKQFAKFVDSKYCVMVNSGSSANLLMIAAMFFRKNNQVQIGKPFLEKSQISARILQSEIKGPKITVLKTKPKKKYTRTRGHRQSYTRIFIDQIN